MDGAPYVVTSSRIEESNETQGASGASRPVVLAVDQKGHLGAERMKGVLERISLQAAGRGFGYRSPTALVDLPKGSVRGLGSSYALPNTAKKPFDRSIPPMAVHSSLNGPPVHSLLPINPKRVADWSPPLVPGGYSAHSLSRHYRLPLHRHRH